jgi:hypothetical protein
MSYKLLVVASERRLYPLTLGISIMALGFPLRMIKMWVMKKLTVSKAKPRSTRGSLSRFDTVVVMVSDECQLTGLQGKCSLVLFNRYKLNCIQQAFPGEEWRRRPSS